jgi:hypothetical protein
MRKALMIVCVLLISVAFVTGAMAQPKPADKPAAAPEKAAPAPAPEKAKVDKPAKAKTMKGGGEVVKIDATEKVIVIKGKKGEEIYDIKDVKWKVYKGAEEVKAGDVVMITYMDKDGKKAATVVAKGGKKAPAKKDAPEAKPAPAPEKAPAAKPAEAPAKK